MSRVYWEEEEAEAEEVDRGSGQRRHSGSVPAWAAKIRDRNLGYSSLNNRGTARASTIEQSATRPRNKLGRKRRKLSSRRRHYNKASSRSRMQSGSRERGVAKSLSKLALESSDNMSKYKNKGLKARSRKVLAKMVLNYDNRCEIESPGDECSRPSTTPVVLFSGGRKEDLAPFHIDKRMVNTNLWVGLGRRAKVFTCDCCFATFETQYKLLKHRERTHERIQPTHTDTNSGHGQGHGQVERYPEKRKHGVFMWNTDIVPQSGLRSGDPEAFVAAVILEEEKASREKGKTKTRSATGSAPRPLSRHTKGKKLSQLSQCSLIAEARLVSSIRARETVLENLASTAKSMKMANHRLQKHAAASKFASGGSDSEDDANVEKIEDIDLKDVGDLISHLLALRRATCHVLLALDAWRGCKHEEEQATHNSEAFESSSPGKEGEGSLSFRSSGGASGGYIWHGRIYCEDMMRGDLLGDSGCLGGGVLPVAINEWMRGELSAITGPRNPLLLRKEMPHEEKSLDNIMSEHTPSERFCPHILSKEDYGGQGSRQVSAHPFIGCGHRSRPQRHTDGSHSQFRAAVVSKENDSIALRDWTWPTDNEDTIPFRMKTRAVMLLGRLLGKTKLKERETDALWMGLNVSETKSNGNIVRGLPNIRQTKKNSEDHNHNGSAASLSSKAVKKEASTQDSSSLEPEPQMNLEQLMARLLDPCADATSSKPLSSISNCLPFRDCGTKCVNVIPQTLTLENLEKAFHILRYENAREYIRQSSIKFKETMTLSSSMAPRLAHEVIENALERASLTVFRHREEKWLQQSAAAVRIQRCWRAAMRGQRREKAARILMSWLRFRLYRGIVAKGWICWQLFVERLRSEEESKWLGLQAKKGWLAAQIQSEAAVVVQRLWRRWLRRVQARDLSQAIAFKRERKMETRRRTAALGMQRIYRGYLGRKRSSHKRDLRLKAALQVDANNEEAAAASWLSPTIPSGQKCPGLSLRRINSSSGKEQNSLHWPGSPHEFWEMRWNAAIQIQRWLRCTGLPLLRKSRERLMNSSAVLVQSVFRGQASRLVVQRVVAAIRLQKLFRGWLVRLNVEEKRNARMNMLLLEGSLIEESA